MYFLTEGSIQSKGIILVGQTRQILSGTREIYYRDDTYAELVSGVFRITLGGGHSQMPEAKS